MDSLQEILYTLRRNKLRTALTAFGVFWGIFMLILLLGGGTGLQRGMESRFTSDMSDAIFISAGKTAIPYKGMGPHRQIELTEGDMEAIRQQIPGVLFLSSENPLGRWRAADGTITYENRSSNFSVLGVGDEFFKIKAKIDFPDGRQLNPFDAAEQRKVAVIGTLVEQALFPPGVDAVGKQITISDIAFTVVGTFYDSGREGRMSERVYIPQSAYEKVFGGGDRRNVLAVRPKPGYDGYVVEEKIKELLQRRHSVSPDDRRAIRTQNVARQAERVESIFSGINAFLWFVGLGTLAAGIVGVSNIMIITVKERTKEIGVRKALGATPVSIVSTLLLESILVTSIAGYAGLVLGVSLLELVSYGLEVANVQLSYFQNPEVDFQVALTSLALLIGVGALAGLVPAIQAARIAPIEAMRAD
jgi:putative ABC transport system permease protein